MYQFLAQVEVNVYPHSSVDEIDESFFEQLSYEHYGSYNSPKRSLPLKLHECQPVVAINHKILNW